MLSDLYIRLRSLFRRAKVDEELDDELRFHQEKQVDKYMRTGMSKDEALRQVRLDFGGVGQVKEDCRDARGISFLDSLVQDLRYSLRMLVKSPVFTTVVIITLALGIGANTAIFTLVNAIMLRSIPVRDPQQLVMAQWSAHHGPSHVGVSSFGDCTHNPEGTTGCTMSYPLFQEIQKQNSVLEDAMAFIGPFQMDLSGNGAAAIAQGQLVSGSYFETLGVLPALGRTLSPDDEKPGAPSVAVLDYGYWQRAFGGSPTVIGRIIHLNNAPFTIIGVTEPGFTRLTPGKSVDLWVSLNQTTTLGLKHIDPTDPTDWWLVVVGRLHAGVSRVQAQAALDSIYKNEMLHGPNKEWDPADDPHLLLLPAQEALTGIRNAYGEPLLLLMAAVGLTLLIACANVAGLMLARAASREREMAVRLAMGASRRRVIRQLLTESLVLSFIGAGLGVLLAPLSVSALASFFSANSYSPLQLDLHVDARILLFTVGVAFLTGVGFGLAPAFRGARTSVTAQLKGNTTTAAASHGRGRLLGLGSVLVILQVTLSMVVLTGAGLLLRSLDKLRNIDPGFDTRNLILFSINPELTGYKDQQITNLYTDLQKRIAALPGVINVTYSSGALLDGGRSSRTMHVQGLADKSSVQVQTLSVGPEYFHTMRIPLLEGRLLNQADTATTNRVLVNRVFVQKYVPGQNPLGLHIGGDDPKDPQWEIVGVVGDTKYDTLRKEVAPTAYMPLASDGATFAIRTQSAPSSLMPAVRNVVNTVDINLPIMRMRTQSDSIDRLLFNERLVGRLLGIFAIVGLLLACIGLYGLLSYEVERRTREIGIRTALGAQRGTIWSMVVWQGIVLMMAGVLVGCGAALGVSRLLKSLLYAVQPTDPATFVLTACLLLLVGILACALPARRATHVDPMTALRCE
ncbi:ADOP family duplicated permease [Acidicapsa dinghuensis]|uniref:ADOP family duplicated permease n=1 Tax=Acidicapsa dinghuensis TaxID=2218256 RepID=A0ABW1EEV4_9BACT|nr:ABC transporter permease [Acidicapsa dinghuensis]